MTDPSENSCFLTTKKNDVTVDSTEIDFRKRGNELYNRRNYLAAIDCYNQALQQIDAAHAISSVLNNYATTTLKIDSSLSSSSVAIFFSSAALSISPHYEKAQVRMLSELSRLSETKHIQVTGNLHADTTILLAVSDSMEKCLDDALAQRRYLPELTAEKAIDLKVKGNTLFAAGRYSDALYMYLSAIQCSSQSAGVALLLSNRAICFQQLQRFAEALQSAIGAACCDPHLVKAHFRRASALYSLGHPKRAEAAAKFGLLLEPKNTALLELNACLEKATKDEDTESELIEILEMQKVNNMFECMSRSGALARGVEMVNRNIPAFHMEFASAGLWPTLTDIHKCERRLLYAYEYGRGAAQFYDGYILSKCFDREHWLKRMQAKDQETVSWFVRARNGEINLNLRNNMQLYDQTLAHWFGNVPNRSISMAAGTTIVSVGFVDLGVLQEATLCTNVSDSAGPVRWVGYEASAYCVAKTAVIISMLHASVPVDSVLQVWYSAAWNLRTLIDFRQAVSRVLDGKTLTGAAHPDVLGFLLMWKSAEVSLSDARSKWLFCSRDLIKWRDIGNFKRAADRKALCAYSLCGQLLDATTGSVAMFVLPSGFKYCIDQRVCECISFRHIAKRCHAPVQGESPNVMEAIVAHLQEGIAKLHRWVHSGQVVVDVRVGALDPANPATLASIAALNPLLITWSNVCDYFQPNDFHRVARACSGPKTVHHAYSMNWYGCVKGAKVLDLMADGVDPAVLITLFKKAKDAVKTTYHANYSGSKDLLVHPPVDDPRNVIDCALYQKWHADFVEAFFALALLDDPKKQVAIPVEQ